MTRTRLPYSAFRILHSAQHLSLFAPTSVTFSNISLICNKPTSHARAGPPPRVAKSDTSRYHPAGVKSTDSGRYSGGVLGVVGIDDPDRTGSPLLNLDVRSIAAIVDGEPTEVVHPHLIARPDLPPSRDPRRAVVAIAVDVDVPDEGSIGVEGGLVNVRCADHAFHRLPPRSYGVAAKILRAGGRDHRRQEHQCGAGNHPAARECFYHCEFFLRQV